MRPEMIEKMVDKRVQVLVAHHDDESLYFGGLLTEIRELARVKITVMTAPAPGRPDTHTRLDSLKKVCWVLGATYSAYDLKDFPPIIENTRHVVHQQIDKARDIVKADLFGFQPDVILTHNWFGEPNPGYVGGHPVHAMVYDAVLAESSCDIFVNAVGLNSYDYEIEYDIGRKKILLDCYAPNWKPDVYPFAYNPERYLEVKR